MSEPFVGEIRMFAGTFAPQGWALCDGQLLAISENDALFSLIGTTYGGDGQTTFALPDMRGRIPLHAGSGPGLSPRQQGSRGGAESVTLTASHLPSHSHEPLRATTARGDQASAQGNVPAASPSMSMYLEDPPAVSLNTQSVTATGGSQSHSNLMPFTCLNFIISLFGIYPSQ